MQFIIGVILFTCVAGWIDRRVPWPAKKKSGGSL